ncbi:MAG TPA: potassium channel protein [Vicinamibacteria bacterium]|nr:potassium channel protein [Vicinamibacteria bacterium]
MIGPGLPRRLALILSVPLVLVALGTAGYHVVEGWSAFDALYMTVITLTTVGFLEVHPLSPAGRTFTMLLALGGIFTLLYAAMEGIRTVVSGELRSVLGRQRMDRTLAEIRDHFVVCGYGRMGSLVCREFSALGLPFVVIDRDPQLLRDFRLPHGLVLVGDATSDDVLRKAGVARARALVTAAASDADNLFITMSARFLNDKLLIVSRAEEEDTERKLLRAGANRVVSPYVIGGQRVAQAVLRPAVMDFIELATRSQHLELQIEETAVAVGSGLAGATIRDSQLRQDLGIIVVAIKKPDGRMVFNPAPELTMAAGDVLIAMGHRQQLDRLEQLAGQPA